MRLNLLYEYGGLWLDSTFYLTNKIPPVETLGEFYTIKNIAKDNNCVAEYRWFVSLLYTVPKRGFIRHIRNMFCYNWMKYNYIVDYLLMDYLFEYESRHNAHFNTIIENLSYNNPNASALCAIMNNEFTEHMWEELKKETYCFKTTYKTRFSMETNGHPTFYNKIINGEI